MRQIPDYSDSRNKSWCIHCGENIGASPVTQDHVPSKCLLLPPYPDNLPAVRICRTCNQGFSADEEYVAALLGCVLSGSSDPDRQRDANIGAILRRQPLLREQLSRARTEHAAADGTPRIVWCADVARVHRVVAKNARGHAYCEFGEPMLDEPVSVWTEPLKLLTPAARDEFETLDTGGLWPEVGSRMMTRVLTGDDLHGAWVVVQEGVYRYGVSQAGGMTVRAVIREYLATEVHWHY